MANKGEYSLDFNSDKVIVDGHEFVKSKFSGVYESVDEYKVDLDDWVCDERNKDLSILAHHVNGSRKCKVLYVFMYYNEFISIIGDLDFVKNCDGKDEQYITTSCLFNTSFEVGFTRGELNI